MPAPFAWNDLELLLALARGGTLSAAARSLGVNHSTVYRRLGALEARSGTRLFERLPEGLVPTAAGAELVEGAGRIEEEVRALERRLTGQDLRLTGSVRVTTPDDLAEALVVPALPRVRAAYPEIALELVIDNRLFDLTRREADIALRPTDRPPESLVGRRIAGLAFAVYGARALVGEAPGDAPDDARDSSPWIGWDEEAQSGGGRIARWLAQSRPGARYALRTNSLLIQGAAARAGLGLAVLPCFLGDPVPELVRLGAPVAELEGALWLLTHKDLRRTARIRAVLDSLFESLRAARPRLEGRTRARDSG